MVTSKRHNKPDRHSDGRRKPFFDRLEDRLALSGSSFDPGFVTPPSQIGVSNSIDSLTVVSTSPPTSAVLAKSPSSFVITFDRGLDPFSMGNADFKLVHVASDGSTTPLGVGETSINEALDDSDLTNSRITLALTKPLLDGRYRLILVGNNTVSGIDGSSLASSGSDVILSDFTMGVPEGGIATATKLQAIDSTELIRGDTLDLAGNPSAVKYYQLTLGPGHHWRLGLAITAQGEGGALTSTLSLFDVKGNLIATNSEGLINAPGDPFLFEGLDPGRYFVGVSARGNIPGPDGVYNPTGSVISNADLGIKGGAFHLHVIADVADQPTQVLGLRVDHADPLSTVPTGLTLQFSGPIGLEGLKNPSQPAVKLVDQDGKAWSLTFANYDSAHGQLSFVFNQALRVGSYSLVLTGRGGLVDLAGTVPIALGQAPGVLGSITVAQGIGTPGDLGPVYPDLASPGLNSIVSVGANTTTSRQFVVPIWGVYALRGLVPANGVGVQLLDAKGNALSVAFATSSEATTLATLKPGLYTLVFTNNRSESVNLPVSIRMKEIIHSDFLEGGVDQGAALNLRLVTPQSNFGQISDPTPAPTILAPIGVNPQSSSSSSNGSPAASSTTGLMTRDAGRGLAVEVGLATPAGPSVAGLLYSTGPVGTPSLRTDQISVVGSTSSYGSLALASNTPGLPSGLIAVHVDIKPGELDEPESTPAGQRGLAEVLPATRLISSLESGLLSRPEQSRRADEQSLADAEWIDRVASNVTGWFESSSPPVNGKAVASSIEVAQVAAPVEEAALAEPTVERASLALSITVGGGLAGLAYRYRRSFLARFRQGCKSGSRESGKHRPIFAGPHRQGRLRVH